MYTPNHCRFVSNGQTVERDTSIEDLPMGIENEYAGHHKRNKAADDSGLDIGCGAMACSAGESSECRLM